MNKIYKYLILISVISLICNSVYSQNNTYRIKTVVVDPGHGGKDPGAVGKRSKEKDLTLAIGLRVGELIKQHSASINVIYTRKTDEFVELYKRAEIANKNFADLFISIHVNASQNVAATGTDTWVMGLHKSRANLEVAKLENKVISIEKDFTTKYEGMSTDSTEAIIVFTLVQGANIEHSTKIASMIQSEFKTKNRKDRGVHSAPFMVLWRTTMPSILVETGFISNLEEEKYLNSPEGQEQIAQAIFNGFLQYKKQIEASSNVTIVQDYPGYEDLPGYLDKKKEEKSTTSNLTSKETTTSTTPKAASDSDDDSEEEETPKTTTTTPISANTAAATDDDDDESETKPTTSASTITPSTAESDNEEEGVPAVTTSTPSNNSIVVQSTKGNSTQTIQTIKTDEPYTITINLSPAQVLKNTKPAQKTPSKSVAANTANAKGVVFGIQIMSGSKSIALTPTNFKGYSNVYVIAEEGLYRYYLGKYATLTEATSQLQKIKQNYPDAFVVARKDGKKISISEAKTLTK